MLGLCCCAGSSLAAANGGYSGAAVCGLLIAVASPVQSPASRSHRLQELRHVGAVAVVPSKGAVSEQNQVFNPRVSPSVVSDSL